MIRFIILAVLVTGAAPASAHTGFENETEVRIFADRMEVNTRATFGFGWKLLAERAPADIGEAGQRIATPLLVDLAPGLFEVKSDDRVMTPRSADCQFELDQHIFLQVVYDRPPSWPLTLRATFFDRLDPLSNGTIRIYDQTDAPYQRDLEPLAQGIIHPPSPVFTYDPRPDSVESPADTGSPQKKSGASGFSGYFLLGIVSLLGLIWFIHRRYFS